MASVIAEPPLEGIVESDSSFPWCSTAYRSAGVDAPPESGAGSREQDRGDADEATLDETAQSEQQSLRG